MRVREEMMSSFSTVGETNGLYASHAKAIDRSLAARNGQRTRQRAFPTRDPSSSLLSF
jgi:hypothetical protein